MTTSLYHDKWVECTPEEVRVRGYYFPWGTKKMPYRSIRGVKLVALSTLRGKPRIWGTANPRYWASLDPQRPKKSTALILDLGHFVRPFITPDDAAAVEAIIRGAVSARRRLGARGHRSSDPRPSTGDKARFTLRPAGRSVKPAIAARQPGPG